MMHRTYQNIKAGGLLSSLPAVFLRVAIGLAAGLAVALVLGRWTWLEMRVNTSLAVLLLVVAAVFLPWGRLNRTTSWTFSGNRAQGLTGPRLLLIAQLALAGVMLGYYGVDQEAWQVLPASLFREGLFLRDSISLNQANGLLLALLVAGNLAVNIKKK